MCGMESVKKALSGDNLVEIPTKNWRELRDLFAPNWPKNHIAWHTINNYINWFRIEPGLENLKIYSLNGAWRGDGTFVVIVSRTFARSHGQNRQISSNLNSVGLLSAFHIHA